MSRVRPPLGLNCPGCGSDLEPLGQGPDQVHRLQCPECGETFKARKRPPNGARQGPPTVGGLGLSIRAGTLRIVPIIYHSGVLVGTTALVALGGFVPVLRGWMNDRVHGVGGVVEAVGGVRIASESHDPDNDLGPILRRLDAPGLFEEVVEVARRLGVRPPDEIRLAFLPCCGVVASRKARALLLGLPLLHVLTLAELRAVLAHELAHLARGDATWSAGALRFVEALGRALEDPLGRSRGPLRLWARLCRRVAVSLVGPLARGQEARADRASASIAGGRSAASALVKVALVQPLFRELLGHHDPVLSSDSNIYSSFRTFWSRLPEPLLESMRLRLLTLEPEADESPHPPLPDRVAMVQTYPTRSDAPGDNLPAVTLLGDPEWLEEMLNDRLFGLLAIEPTVFHKAGT
jgi:Peptidase family M48